MRIVGKAESGQWIKATNQAERVMAKALTISTRQLGKAAVQKGREAITSAGFSQRFARSLIARNKPPSGYVLNPSVYIHTTINYADVFESGRTIVGDPYLWLPLPNVPPFKGRKHMTPKQYVSLVGPLVTMRRPGKTPLLGAPVRGPVRSGRRITRGRFKKGATAPRRETQLVPMFVGVRSITIPKKFDVTSAVEQVSEEFQEAYDRNEAPDAEIK